MPNKTVALFWFRQDLRLSDNPALFEATQNGTLMPIYILDDEEAHDLKMGAASRWWLYHSLVSLNKSLDGKLNLYRGSAEKIIFSLLEKQPISAVYWNRCYEPRRIEKDTKIKTLLQNRNVTCKSFNGSLLWEPWEVLKTDHTPYKVFTPFYRQAISKVDEIRNPLPSPKKAIFLQDLNNRTTLDNLELLPKISWYRAMEPHWKIGEQAAQQKLSHFLKNNLLDYKKNRDEPSKPNTSGLSPYLHFGEISPNQIWHAVQLQGINALRSDATHFLRELAWREFSYSLLYHFPSLPDKNFQPKFDSFPWKDDATLFQAWQQGKTGYPIIDAGMRELWQTGTMHNRVRMITASFLVKNLLIHWKDGAAWFWDCLVDADLANNSASWQWVAGSGADAAPYFRIFNPILQGEKFDKDGIYTRRFLPELAALPKKWLFKPWEAPEPILQAAGITLGKTYPHPIVNLQLSRNQALEVYQKMKNP